MDWSSIGTEALKVVVGVVGSALVGLVMTLLVKVLQRVNISIDAGQQQQVQDLLFRLVAQTEEWAAGKLKRGMPVTAADKANYYLSLVSENAAKLPDVTPDAAVSVSKQVLGTAKLAANVAAPVVTAPLPPCR